MIRDAELLRILDEGLTHFNAGRFFEAHDKLEEAWKEVKHEKKSEKASDPRRDLLHGLILLSVAFHHWRRGNAVGALRKWGEAERLFALDPPSLGVPLEELRARSSTLFRRLRNDPKSPLPESELPRIRRG